MKILGIDFGEKRIGLALSDNLGIIATPLPNLNVITIADAITKIHKISHSHNVEKIVVGLPLGPNREETQQSIKIRYFANSLANTNGTEVEFWNETLTSKDAEKSPLTKKGKKNLDSEAARIILQEYLDSQKE